MKLLSNKRRYSLNILLIYLLVAFFLGILILRSYVLSIAIVLALPVFIILKNKPEIGILTIVILISSIIFEDALPLISIGSGSFHISDAILLLLLFLIPFNSMIDKRFRIIKTPLDAPLLLFYLATLLTASLAIYYYKVDFNETLRHLRVLTYYLLFFVVTNLIRSERQVHLLSKGLFFIGVGVGLAVLAQALIGESVPLMPGRIEMASTFERTYEATRILPPGQSLVYVLFITGICLIAFREKGSLKVGYYLLVLFTGIGIALTYNRSFWVACLSCLIVFVLFANSRVRKRLIAICWICSLLIILFWLVLLPSNVSSRRGGGTISAMSDRFISIVSGSKLYKSESFEWRRVENKYALQQIVKHPFLGIGLGKDYRPPIFGSWDTFTRYIHNGYLWILLDVGLIGLLPLLWFFVRFVIRGFRNWDKIKDAYMNSLLTGFTLSVLGALLINMVSPVFEQWFSIVVFSTIIGLSEVIIRINEIEVKRSNE